MNSFCLSASSVINEFIEQSSKKLEAFENRDLSEYDMISLFIDGKHQAKEQIIIVLGVTLQGDKRPLGILPSHSKNSKVIKELLSKLVEHGLD